MIPVGNAIVSEELVKEQFVCDLNKCKGACCVQGESGAPLEESELEQLESIYEKVKPYLTKEGIIAIEQKGLYLKDEDDDWVTPLIGKHGACAFTIYNNGIAACGIEKAYRDGKINFQKPVSCHLYPVRITSYKNYDAVNYHKWEICSPACALGKELKVPVYEFVKDALIRKYGASWFAELKQSVEDKKQKSSSARKIKKPV